MISSLIVLLLVASISVLTTTPLIFHCCKKKEKKDNKKQAKQPEKGGGGPGLKSKEVAAKDAAGKDAAAKDGGAKPPSAEQVQKKPDDKKKTPAGKGDAKNVKPPVTYHVMKGKPTSSELAKKATTTAQVAMPPTTTLPPATGTPSNTAFKDPAKQSSGGKDAVSGQKPPDGDAKNINGSKATEVKSKTNEDAQPSKSNTAFDEATPSKSAQQKITQSNIDGVEVPPTALTETSKRDEGAPEEGGDPQLYETVPGGGAPKEEKPAPADEAGGSYESIGDLNLAEQA